MSLDEADLLADVRSRLFAPSRNALTIGAELELIPLIAATKLPAPIDAASGPSVSACVRRAAGAHGWNEIPIAGNPSSWNLPGGSRLSFEPGGQIEISSRPHESCSELVTSLQEAVGALSDAARADGIELLTSGTDPHNDISAVELQLNSDRYLRMARYLEARSEFGPRMMRQTAALQISVEHGPQPFERWQLLNSMAPYIIAIFANSSRYAGRETGHASYRAHFWRELDASRTGIPFDLRDPAGRYANFALDAGTIRAENGAGEFRPFRSLLDDKTLTRGDWEFHLSTLFPEIRPKEYFEIRSADAIEPENLAVPMTFVAGLVYDERASAEAVSLLGVPNEKLLITAGREGLRDSRLRSTAATLVGLSLEGASRLPSNYLSLTHRDHAAAWLAERVS